MSNFLTNIRLNNLQQEIDNLVLSGPLQNPLGKVLDCGGFAIENAGSVQAASITTPSFTTTNEIAAGYIVATGNIEGNTFTQTYGGTTYASIDNGVVTAAGVDTDGIASKTTGASVLVASELDMHDNSLTNVSYIGFNGVVVSGVTGPLQTIANFSTPTHKSFGYSDLGGADQVTFYDNVYNKPPGLGGYGTLEQVLTEGNTANGKDITNVGNLQAVEFQQTNGPGGVVQTTIKDGGVECLTLSAFNIAGTDAGSVNMTTAVDMNSNDITGAGTISGAIVGGGSVNATTLTTTYITGTNSAAVNFNNDIEMEQHNISNVGQLQLSNNSDPTKISNLTTGAPGGDANTLWVYHDSRGYGAIYDTLYNQPPTAATPTLDEVLTAGASAPSKTITVGGVITDALGASAALGIIVNGSLRMTETPTLASYLTFINTDNDYNAINTVTDGALGPTLCVTRDGTTKGFIYDSHYNQPPTAAASTLEEVLAANSVALGSQSITVGGLVGNHAVDSTHTDEYLSVGSDVDYSLYNQLNIRSSSIVDASGVNKNILLTDAPYSGADEEQLYITRGDGQYGAVYDSHYNQPPSGGVGTLEQVLNAGATGPAGVVMNVSGVAGIRPSEGEGSLHPNIWLSIGTDTDFLNKNVRGITAGYIGTLSSDSVGSLSGGGITIIDDVTMADKVITANGVYTGTLYTDLISAKTAITDTVTIESDVTLGAKGITAGTVVGTTSVTTNTITGTGTYGGLTVLNMGTAVNMNNYPVAYTPYVGFNGEGVNNTPALYKTIQNKSTPSYTGFGYSDYGGGNAAIFYDNKYNLPPVVSSSITQTIPNGANGSFFDNTTLLPDGSTLGAIGTFDLGSESFNIFSLTFDSLILYSPDSTLDNAQLTFFLTTGYAAYPSPASGGLTGMTQCSYLTTNLNSNAQFTLSTPGILQSTVTTANSGNVLYLMLAATGLPTQKFPFSITFLNGKITADNVPNSVGSFIPTPS